MNKIKLKTCEIKNLLLNFAKNDTGINHIKKKYLHSHNKHFQLVLISPNIITKEDGTIFCFLTKTPKKFSPCFRVLRDPYFMNVEIL